MSEHTLGIDIAKDTVDVTLLGGPQRYQGHFTNDVEGFQKLSRWLKHRDVESMHACMEATNRYWETLAYYLHESGYTVSVVNPKRIRDYGNAKMQRNKTDPADAELIADYCLRQEPRPWTPPPSAYQELKLMVRRLVALKEDRQRERNRRANDLPAVIRRSIDDHLDFLNHQIDKLEQQINDYIAARPTMQQDKELLVSIPGVGDIVAHTFMAEVPDVSLFPQAPQVAAYAGLTPGRKESGTSRHSPGHLVKWGDSYLRRVLYMPALSAHQHNPIIASLRERLRERGKSKMTVVVAVMRKLLHLCYGVLKTRKPFDPNHVANASAT